jgi:dTDP-4-amino-4,6-dideoxygalactose transaminase
MPSNIPSEGFNYYTFYLLTTGKEEKNRLIAYLLKKGIQAVSHYLDLSESSFIKERQYREYQNINCRRYQDTLLRLPLFFDLEDHQIETICDEVKSFYE